MNDDLSDVGLNALEALEAKDQQEQENSAAENEVDEKDTSETNGTEESSEKNNEPDEEQEDSGENGEETEEDSEEEDKSDDDSEEKKKDGEMSDEEFEELAKKRGYSKDKTEEETNKEEENSRTMEKLLARPKEISEEIWAEVPKDNKIIYNALPYLVAEGKKGVIQVKTPEQLPEDFEFKNDRARMKFENDLQAQENMATQFKQALEARAERERVVRDNRAEAERTIGEINSLQKSGELPTPKAKYGTKEFDSDPAVVLINKVLSYRVQRANEGTNLSVRDSFMLYKATHPEEFKKKEARGDIERRNIAKKVAGNSKSTSSAVNAGDSEKPQYYKPGMSTEDVVDAIMNDMD